MNDVFYRKEPHEMRRYTRAGVRQHLEGSARVRAGVGLPHGPPVHHPPGTGDQATTFQYRGSRLIFNAGLILSFAYLAAFLAGVIIAWRARSPFLYALIPIVYVPLTICFVLTNMRYTITVQPLMFVFVALAMARGLRLDRT